MSLSTWAQPIPETVNLMDMHQAEAYANRMLDVLESSDAGSRDNPLQVYHYGETIPNRLKWVLTRLRTEGYRIQLEHISSANKITNDFFVNLDNGRSLHTDASNNITVGPKLWSGTPSIEDLVADQPLKKKISTRLKTILGLPHGLTLFVKVNRSEEDARASKNLGIIQGTIAGVSMSVAYYSAALTAALKTPELLAGESLPVHVSTAAGAAMALFAWMYMKFYNYKVVNEVMFQGKTVAVDKSGEIIIRRADLFTLGSNFIRGLATNAIVMVGIYGFYSASALVFDPSAQYEAYVDAKYLSLGALEVMISNALINMLARSKIDNWIQQKTPIERSDGRYIIQSGQFTEGGARKVRYMWEASYGLARNLHLVQLGPATDAIYLSLAFYNLIWSLDEKYNRGHLTNAMAPHIDNLIDYVRKATTKASQVRSNIIASRPYMTNPRYFYFSPGPGLALTCKGMFK